VGESKTLLLVSDSSACQLTMITTMCR